MKKSIVMILAILCLNNQGLEYRQTDWECVNRCTARGIIYGRCVYLCSWDSYLEVENKSYK